VDGGLQAYIWRKMEAAAKDWELDVDEWTVAMCSRFDNVLVALLLYFL